MGRLAEASVPSGIYYPNPLHLQKAFESLKYAPGDFPVSEDVASRIFALPMHPYLTSEDQESIVKVLKG
jgi:dTDP-4-amino-4,6-dideoxygalactose transaminase